MSNSDNNNNFTLDAGSAEADFERFADMMDLDLDESEMTEEEAVNFQKQRRKLLSAIMDGHVTVSDTGEPTVHLKRPLPGGVEKLTFHEPEGSTLLTIDKARKGADNQRMIMLLADLCGRDPSTFAKVKQRDLRVCMVIATLFLA